MQANDNILDLLKEKRAQAARTARRGVILQPGAIGDCILTLPLAELMKNCLWKIWGRWWILFWGKSTEAIGLFIFKFTILSK